MRYTKNENIRKRNILINNSRTKANYVVKLNDVVTLKIEGLGELKNKIKMEKDNE